jgi:uncharacterized membrane protein YphA (DoxX/SURF4 family)
VQFLKLFAVVLLLVGPAGAVLGLLPYPVIVVAALALLGLAIYHHRNRSLA